MNPQPDPSPDLISAFVELAQRGNFRSAAEALFITEQAVRRRLLMLEACLGTELYRKSRGRRPFTPLTPQGKRFLPQAIAFLQMTRETAAFFRDPRGEREIHVVASQYLIAYVLVEAVRRFHAAYPHIQVRLSARSEAEIERTLPDDPFVAFGVAAPYEASSQLDYRQLFSMDWSVIAPKGHALLRTERIRLEQTIGYPLIMYERGSTGRQHVLDALRERNLSPAVELEATNTDLIVRMVEAGLGVSIVPLLPSGVVTRGRRVGIRPLGKAIRPIHSGILMRRNETPSAETQALIEFIQRGCAGTSDSVRSSVGKRK